MPDLLKIGRACLSFNDIEGIVRELREVCVCGDVIVEFFVIVTVRLKESEERVWGLIGAPRTILDFTVKRAQAKAPSHERHLRVVECEHPMNHGAIRAHDQVAPF